MRCVGATQATITRVYVLEMTLLALLAAGAAVLDISEGDAETADDEDETGHKKKKRAGGKLRRLFGT